MTFCSPKKLLFLQKSLFLDGAHVRIINLFIKKSHIGSQNCHSPIVGSLYPLCLACPLPINPYVLPFWAASETGDFNTALHFIHFSSEFCPFFKFSFQINPNALKRIEYQNNPYIYPGYSFRTAKMLQCGELEKWTNHNFVFIS